MDNKTLNIAERKSSNEKTNSDCLNESGITVGGKKNACINARLRSLSGFVLRIFIAVAIIVWIIHSRKEALLSIKDVNWFFIILAALLYFIQFICGALRWSILLKIQNFKIRFLEVFSLYMIGVFSSLVIPGGAIGGDVVKAGILAKRSPKGSRIEAMFTILIDRVIGMVALFLFTILVAMLSSVYMQTLLRQFLILTHNWSFNEFLQHPVKFTSVIVFAVLVLCLAGITAAAALFFHRCLERIKLFALLIKYADKLLKGAVSRMNNAMDLFRNSTKYLLVCFVISVIGIHLMICLVGVLVMLALGGTNEYFSITVFALLIGNIAGLIPLTPSGVGIRDVVIIGVLSSVGMPDSLSAAVPLIFTGLIIFFNIFSGLFLIFQPETDISLINYE